MTKKIVNEFLCELMCEQLATMIKQAADAYSWSSKREASAHVAAADACEEVPALTPIVAHLILMAPSIALKFCNDVLRKVETGS